MSERLLRVVIVDDEILARQRIEDLLAKEENVTVAGMASDGPSAIEAIREQHPDLVFLDVQMPGMDGFEVLKNLRGPMPQVVFSTAYDEYAIRAFEVEAIDYLLKPYGRQRVEAAVDRVRQRRATGAQGQELESMLRRLADGKAPQYVTQVPVYSGRRILLLPVEEVRWFGVEHRLVYAHNAERGFMTNYTLRELEERLDAAVFFRAHKASLVNLQHVKEIVPWFGGRYKLVMRDQANSEVAVSRSAARTLRSRLHW